MSTSKIKANVVRGIRQIIPILTIISMLLSSFPLSVLSPPAAQAQTPSETLYRAQVTLAHAYDTTRLAEMGLTVNEVSDGQTIVVASKEQLATLARRGFQPSDIVAMTTLSQLAGGDLSTADLTTLDAPDSDGDGLTDQEEEWWCTDPTDSNSDSPLPPSPSNPSDGDEAQAIMNGVTAYGPPFALWPQFTPYNPSGTCPDGDFDGVPDIAEEFIIGTSPLRESSDKDKFDDGQELFGVTFCPGSSGPCGYGILPRAEDAAFVSANLPAWVLPPGDSPWVAAFPEPEVEVVPSSIKVVAVTTIETEKTITEGEEHTYGTATTKGTSSSIADTVTWNEWQAVSIERPLNSQTFLTLDISSQYVQAAFTWGWNAIKSVCSTSVGGAACYEIIKAGAVKAYEAGKDLFGPKTYCFVSDEYSEEEKERICAEMLEDENQNTCSEKSTDDINNDAVSIMNSTSLSCTVPTQNLVEGTPEDYIRTQAISTENQDQFLANEGHILDSRESGRFAMQPVYSMNFPLQPTMTTEKGIERGGAQTTTQTEYEEQTISEAFTNQFSESWTNATAVDTAHAADLRFTYSIVNNGTEYAREVSSLLFNIYIGDDPNAAYTYVAVGATGQIALVENIFPGESLNFTSNPIPLNLDEMQAIDEGTPIRIVMEDIAFGQDQAFYQDALNGSVRVMMEDGFDDDDETVDTYLIPVWAPSDTVQDVLKRYFPATEDEDGSLLSLSTPEFDTNPPTFNQHALTGTSWWNIYMSNNLSYTGAIKNTLAQPSSAILIRILSDRDLDGYNDRNETKLGTDPDDPASHPNPELLAGYTTDCVGNDCTVLMSFLNTGNYDAYGVEAIMYSPDGLTDITNNTIGGSGRIPAGQQVVLGTRILQPNLNNWTGGGQPYSTGFYQSDVDRTLTFTATAAGNIGAGSLNIDWSDDQGGSGTVDFGAAYQAPLPMAITQGIQLGFQTGGVNNGETFTIQALTPRDTFQYTISQTQAISPVIVVSYNDPQGNHRFILPSEDYPTGSHLSDLNSDLLPLSGQMIPGPGVDIASTADNQANFILNAPHPISITDSHLFVEYIDSDGNVDREDVFTQTLETGPTVIPVTVDTNTYTPTDYILLAFMTDSQGNIIDSSARPLASFGPDPLPVANLTAGDWQVGTFGIQSINIPDPWTFGTVEAGTLLSAELTLANTGLGSLQYALGGLNNGLSVAGAGVGTLAPTESRVFNLTIDTAGFSAGSFNRTVTLRTSDPNNASIAINLTGTITGASGDGTAYQVNVYRPWDQYVAVPGPHNLNDTVVFSHTISDETTRMHPLYLHTEDENILKGYGEYGPDLTGETASFGIFGTGADGDLTVNNGETELVDNVRQLLASTASSGQNLLSVASTSGFNVGDEVLIIQIRGTNSGNHEFRYISSVGSNSLTLNKDLEHTYQVGGSSKVQVLRVPHYRNVTVHSGGTLGIVDSSGGTLAVRVSNSLVVQGNIDVIGKGHHYGEHGYRWNNTYFPAYRGGNRFESPNQSTSSSALGMGGGAGIGDGGGGKGGGGGGGVGSAGTQGGDGGGQGGSLGTTDSTLSILLPGGGGGGGGADSDEWTNHGGTGGDGGGIVFLGARSIDVSGSILARGEDGGDAGHCESGSSGAGGGGGGSVKIIAGEANLGTNRINVSGGTGGSGCSPGTYGGNGGQGRIRIEYCDTLSGTTNPAASTEKLSCFILRQNPGLPANDTELILPDVVSASTTIRYLTQYGQRSTDTNGSNQLFAGRLPNRGYSNVSLSALVERAAGSGSTFNFCLDFGNDGTCDWTPAQQSFSGPVQLDTTTSEATTLAIALNAYIQAQGSSAENLLIPIRVNIDTPADIFLFNLVAAPGQDIDLEPGPLVVLPYNGASPSEITEGISVTLSTVLSNTGIYTAENFTVAFYDGDPANEGTLIGATFIEDLAAADTKLISQSWDTTGLLGARSLYVQVDLNNSVAESNENNNSQATPAIVIPKLTGPDILTIDSGGGDTADPAYDPVTGHGWLTAGTVVNSCGVAQEKTYRQASSVSSLDYRFDNLAPDRAYHLDLTFGLCGGERWVDIFVDDEQVGETIAGLGGGQLIGSTHITTALKTVSILLNPATYTNGSIKLSIRRADGLGGPLVNIIDLREVRYCYRDSGPGELSWTNQNNCGYDPVWPSDVYDGWGTEPAETIRFNESGQVKYNFTKLNPASQYSLGLTVLEGDSQSRQQQLKFDTTLDQTFTLNSSAQRIFSPIPLASYADGAVTLTIENLGGGNAIVSEVALEEITRRYPGDSSSTTSPTPPLPGSPPQVDFSGFLAYWDGSEVKVEWSTTTEINNTAFTIFRSPDAQTWIDIHTEPSSRACGNYTGPTPVQYAFTDTGVVPGNTYYYRIQFSGEGCGATVANLGIMAQANGGQEGQSFQLNSGWRLISFGVEPLVTQPGSVLSMIDSRYDRVLGELGVYSTDLPDPFNTLTALQSKRSYYLRITDLVGASLLVEGTTVAVDAPISLHAGWNWVGYLPKVNMPLGVALQSISGNYQRVISLDKVYEAALPQFSTLQELEPGQGYLIFMTNPATLIYPTSLGPFQADLTINQGATCDNISPTPHQTLIYGQVNLNDDPAPPGARVEAVTPRGGVAGCFIIQKSGQFGLMQIYGEDDTATPSIDGFRQGEAVTFQVNGVPAEVGTTILWQDDWDIHSISLNGDGADSGIYLPVILKNN